MGGKGRGGSVREGRVREGEGMRTGAAPPWVYIYTYIGSLSNDSPVGDEG